MPESVELSPRRRALAQFLALVARTGATVFPTSAILCTQTVCPTYDEAEGVLYFNGGHLFR